MCLSGQAGGKDQVKQGYGATYARDFYELPVAETRLNITFHEYFRWRLAFQCQTATFHGQWEQGTNCPVVLKGNGVSYDNRFCQTKRERRIFLCMWIGGTGQEPRRAYCGMMIDSRFRLPSLRRKEELRFAARQGRSRQECAVAWNGHGGGGGAWPGPRWRWWVYWWMDGGEQQRKEEEEGGCTGMDGWSDPGCGCRFAGFMGRSRPRVKTCEELRARGAGPDPKLRFPARNLICWRCCCSAASPACLSVRLLWGDSGRGSEAMWMWTWLPEIEGVCVSSSRRRREEETAAMLLLSLLDCVWLSSYESGVWLDVAAGLEWGWASDEGMKSWEPKSVAWRCSEKRNPPEEEQRADEAYRVSVSKAEDACLRSPESDAASDPYFSPVRRTGVEPIEYR